MQPSRYRVIEAYQSPYPLSIVFDAGNSIKVVKKFAEDPEWKDWYWCEAADGRKAWVPNQYLTINGDQGTFNRPYDARELSLQVGEELIVFDIVNGFGMAKNSRGESGWAPMRNLDSH